MINTTPNQHSAKSAYFNPYACKANLQRLRRITVEEPLKPYTDFQQLKMTKVNAKKINPSKSSKQKKPKPFIQLQGEWLIKAGFSTGKHCLIEVYKGMLVITLDEPINSEEKII
jgi:hypothetical protein